MKEGKQPRSRADLLKLASAASVITAVFLIVAKLAAWSVTGSVSLLASLVDSVMDSIASLINLFAIRYACNHPMKITASDMARPNPWPVSPRRLLLPVPPYS